MTIWRAGMLAVCVDDRACPVYGKSPQKKGEIYCVSKVKTGKDINTGVLGTGLKFKETRGRNLYESESRFRPAVLDHQEKQSRKANWLDDVMKGRVPMPEEVS